MVVCVGRLGARRLRTPRAWLHTSAAARFASHAHDFEVHPSRMPRYDVLVEQLGTVRELLGDRPLTLAEKILYTHLINPQEDLAGAGADAAAVRGNRYLKLRVDRLAMQDASAQMALLQFMTCGLREAAVPASVHCDHLIRAYAGADEDLKRSLSQHHEVFAFLESACQKYGIEFWRPGSGIIHQIVLENYAAPGMLMLGTDSHTPNASGLGCLAIGVGGADAVDAMTATPWELSAPRILGVRLHGELHPWCSTKDVILHLAGKLTVRGGTGYIVEYFGDGLQHLPCTGLATMSNMGAEIGATTSAFPYTDAMGRYLAATRRGAVANAAARAAAAGLLQADSGAEYDKLVEVNLSELEPSLNGPFTPDLNVPLSQFVARARDDNDALPKKLAAALIGSCTNSSYADMSRCADLARQASEAGLHVKAPFDVTPGSEQVRATVERDGIQAALTGAGARVLANACGPCIGQWKRTEYQGETNVILTSFNRNFRGRNDGNAKTLNFLAAPEIVTAYAFSGRLDWNPIVDSIQKEDGTLFRFDPPKSEELPSAGFAQGDTSYLPAPMPAPRPSVPIAIDPQSERLEVLQPFDSPFKAQDTQQGKYELPPMRCLLRIRGKCTTDHISAAGPWLKYKGHLSNLAENTLIGASNDETGNVNETRDYADTDEPLDTIPGMAKRWRTRGQPWMLVADHNYGEGSAREHAALQPRLYGCHLVLARSIARIAETNLRKQGVLTLLFENEDDYLKIASGDLVETLNLSELLRPGADLSTQVRVRVTKFEHGAPKTVFELRTTHSLSKTHLDWIRAGSALNLIRARAQKKSMPPSGAPGKLQARPYTTSAVRRALPEGGQPSNDSRYESLRQIIFPPAPAKSKKHLAPATLQEALGCGAQSNEIYQTVRRAWKLRALRMREAHADALRTKRALLNEAILDLQRTDRALFKRADQYSAPTKRNVEEQQHLAARGLLPGGPSAEGEAPGSRTLAKRRARLMAQTRLSTLFPRELRPPTLTPPAKGWPAYTPQDA
ncbi:aconitate hydratase [Malassezia vespertilionis]|uniref:Aco2p n=1 Tax=Malassezia vespertilionis TaxID=2020962 RepID=A0A2N1JE89_9BASI|nr:aconitate hydratase [Malassezia vespertilionis]PKI84853.1 Aco2p [Malassezia vespertilionis]WFD06017.1 aconitate hydratase [Malassezia vespertilionis]